MFSQVGITGDFTSSIGWIWCSRTADEDLDEEKPDCNIISLSEAFWQEIQSHPIPVDVRVVRELTNNSGCLDLYMWLSLAVFQREADRAHSAVWS